MLHKRFIIESTGKILLSIGGLWVIYRMSIKIRNKNARHRMLEKWKVTPKDVVIVHTLPRGKTAPSLSPFVVKLETYLRMQNIPYEMDFEYPWSDKGKTPWITLNGKHIADSQLIIEHLINHFKPPDSNQYTKQQKGVAHSVRIMLEEHLYWGLGLWRYVYSEGIGLDKIFDMSPSALNAFYTVANKRVKTNSWYQGVGRHDKEEVIKMMKKNLQAISAIISDDCKFLLGDQPCVEDCSVFGFLVQVFWCAPGSPYEKYANDELVNLKEYCNRMKETFWPDWDLCLAVST